MIYKYANFGDCLKTIIQRLTYIYQHETPKKYSEDSRAASFKNLQSGINELLNYMRGSVSTEWNTIVETARSVSGVEPKQHRPQTQYTERPRDDRPSRPQGDRTTQRQFHRTDRPHSFKQTRNDSHGTRPTTRQYVPT